MVKEDKQMMKSMFRKSRILLFLMSIFLVLQSCTHVISKKMREQANRSLTFEEVQGEPDRYVGNSVILGGFIIETINRQDATYIKMLQTPLKWGEEPRDSEYSKGRFLLKHTSHLDPEIYKKGSRLSVAGKILGKEILPIGEISYTYPLILAEEIHLWKEQERYTGEYYPHSYYWDYWDRHFYRPGWGFHHYHHYPYGW